MKSNYRFNQKQLRFFIKQRIHDPQIYGVMDSSFTARQLLIIDIAYRGFSALNLWAEKPF